MTLNPEFRSLDHDDRADMETIYTSLEGILVSTISAFISCAASILVISLIIRSEKGLSGSVYHRIMFGMSIADLLQSLPMALTTLPMPTDMIYRNGYQYQGLIIGNNTSCNVQGYLIYLGAMASIVYNASLSVYYLCSLKYNMSDEDFKRRIEPSLHIFSIVPAIIIPIFTIDSGEIHPDPRGATWCQTVSYPWWCKGEECIGGTEFTLSPLDLFGGFIVFASPLVIIICMVLITMGVYGEEQMNARNYEELQMNARNEDMCLLEVQPHIFNNIKIITKQALAYSSVSLLNFGTVVGFPAADLFLDRGIITIPPSMDIVFLVLRPMQGLLNAIIFIGHKAHSLQRRFKKLSFLSAIKQALDGEEWDDQVIGDMKIVKTESSVDNLHLVIANGNVYVVAEDSNGEVVLETMRIPRNDDFSKSLSDEMSNLIVKTPEQQSTASSSHDLSGFSQILSGRSRSFGTFDRRDGGQE